MSAPEEPKVNASDDGSEGPEDAGDPNLSVLVRIANTGGMTLGVTLLVGGAVVSGLLVGAGEFFEGLANYIDERADENGSVLAKVYRNNAQDFRKHVGTDFETAFNAPYVATYIHLRDARVFAPGGSYLPGNDSFYWRGRLDSVDGWSIGSLGT